ncbi:iron-containing redox enzyme family protein [Ruania halotolerans]|uniref:iron-containing redox enzyme family protein n=1 Tax=Ruania halotolerans TaxID=2897773 RepID=UPI001E29A2AF|nr:iron-containing redox enzyme family protein [Ruania halotolerans]UFU06105.1 iron-containing redox enzyme family protein [Ruania halotolerans]
MTTETVEGYRPPEPDQASLLARLADVWTEFEAQLADVPILRALADGDVSVADYQRLLHNLRQQVVDGSLWIARAASNFDMDHFDLRSAAISHALEEHRDHLLLERDYVAVGGSLEQLRAGRKNIGSQALSGYMFHQASQPNPIGCLGAMFIIEGLGAQKALAWAERFQEVLGLADNQVHFMRYHQEADAEHTGTLDAILTSDRIDGPAGDAIVSCARVVARLYVMQLTELDQV